jgi:hypothetical protein
MPSIGWFATREVGGWRRSAGAAALTIGIFGCQAAASPPTCIIDAEHPRSACTADALDAVRETENLVRAYFEAPPEQQYQMLSDRYREMLQNAFKITNAAEYKQHVEQPEFVWRQPQVVSVEYFKEGGATLEVLGKWESEGYKGVRTFIFELERAPTGWRILNLVY